LLRLDGRELLAAAESTQPTGGRSAGDRAGIARDITRETLLYNAALLITDWHLLADQPIGRELLAHEFPLMPGPITLTASGRCDVAAPRDWRVTSVEFPLPDTALRRQIWERAYNGTGTVDASVSLDFLAAGFRFSENQIQRAALRARTEADLFERGHLTQSDLLAGCYAESNRGLNFLAVRVSARPRWADLILRPEPQRQLHELCNHVRHSGTVYQGWGFGAGHTSSGVHALFVGSPGTGKTMAASVIAAELGLELYRIDLSSLVSKYIGETEKNLSRIFDEAGTSNAILFFDEADALFGKRGEVKDAQDRYANMEVSYLLQKMEDFPGITILATNFRANLDKAFVRRLNFIVDFPFPDATERMSIWERNLPAKAPVARDVDLGFLAARLDVPGALIKNIARNAAFLAAAEHSAISMRHIRRAAVREYQKDNRPVPDLTVETR
jgi:ATP-dependent 26S proteasome regulatory subunit